MTKHPYPDSSIARKPIAVMPKSTTSRDPWQVSAHLQWNPGMLRGDCNEPFPLAQVAGLLLGAASLQRGQHLP